MAIEPSPLPRRSERRGTLIVALGGSLCLGALGSGWVPLALRPLNYLGIPYPYPLRYVHLALPAMILVIWIVCRRPAAAMAVTFVLSLVFMGEAARWADARPARIPLTRWLDGIELEAAEGRLGFKITEVGNRDGTFLLVARENERAATEEARRLGVCRP